MANYHHNNYNNNRNSQGGHNNHHSRPHHSGRNHHNQNREDRENRDKYENRDKHEGRDNREGRENRGNRDNQVISTFVLGTKELDDKTAEFQYDKGWYSITDIVGEEKNMIYKSRNAQEAYTKWNVYIGRKKERSQKAE